MQIPLLFVVFLGVHRLQHDIGLGWLLDGDHFQNVALDGHSFGERCLTDLALEFREIIRQHNIIQLFFYFAVNPILQTTYMDKLTRALANARAD